MAPTRDYFTIEWYRPHHLGRMARICIPGGVVVVIGSLFLAAGWIADTELSQIALMATGIAFTIAGTTAVTFGIARVLADDTYLELRSDGVMFKRNEESRFVAWEALDDATADAESHALELHADGDTVVVREAFIGIDTQHLASRILDLRRKALMNLLRRPAPPQGSYL